MKQGQDCEVGKSASTFEIFEKAFDCFSFSFLKRRLPFVIKGNLGVWFDCLIEQRIKSQTLTRQCAGDSQGFFGPRGQWRAPLEHEKNGRRVRVRSQSATPSHDLLCADMGG